MALCTKDNLRAGVRTSGAIELVHIPAVQVVRQRASSSCSCLVLCSSSWAVPWRARIIITWHSGRKSAMRAAVRHGLGFFTDNSGMVPGLIFIALLYPIPAWFASYAAKYHNKFMLLMHGLLLIGLVVMQLMIGGAMYGTATPTFAYDFASMCLVNVNLANATTLAQCRAYFESEEYAMLALAWQTYYNESLVSESAGHAVTAIEDGNVCCGLGPPERCQADTRPFPSDLPTTDATQRQFCAALKIAFVLVTVCFLFKRKDEDVLPTDLAFGPRGRAKVYVAADIRRLERAL
ncbi:unnamed protein product [Aphanomyces euteiches]